MKYSHDVSTVRNTQRWINNHRCSDCWEDLELDPQTQAVSCATPECECNGIVHIQTVLRRELESRELLGIAQRQLTKNGYQVPGYNPAEHTQAAILSQLGF